MHPADLTEARAADGCADAAVGRFGRLDGLVHAAGIVRRGEDIRTTTDDQWAEMRDINLDATFRGPGRACARWCPGAAGRSCSSAASSRRWAPGYASYCAVKGAVEALVRALAVDFGPSGIRVNSLTPGLVQTPLADVDRPDFDDQIETIAARLPLRRIGQPDDMAGLAVFLLSDDSAWMTGQSLVVDGGYTVQRSGAHSTRNRRLRASGDLFAEGVPRPGSGHGWGTRCRGRCAAVSDPRSTASKRYSIQLRTRRDDVKGRAVPVAVRPAQPLVIVAETVGPASRRPAVPPPRCSPPTQGPGDCRRRSTASCRARKHHAAAWCGHRRTAATR